MKKSEKIVLALLTVGMGVLLIALRGRFISILMTVLGLGLIAFAVLDFVNKVIPTAVVKLVAGIVVIVCGWAIVGAVLYIVAGLLLIAGILLLYEKFRKRAYCDNWYQTVVQYAVPALFIVIGILFLFHQGNTVSWIFIVGGCLTIVEGGLLLINALSED
jgi:hypothetical protein